MVVFAGLLPGRAARGRDAGVGRLRRHPRDQCVALAAAIERVVLRPLVNQPAIILFMATFGLTFVLIGSGQLIFGGENKVMITEQLGIPTGSWEIEPFGGFVLIEPEGFRGRRERPGPRRRARRLSQPAPAWAAPSARSGTTTRRALSVGISLSQIWVIVWFIAGHHRALVTGIVWGARAGVSFALEIIAFKALPVLLLGGLESVTGAIVGGIAIGVLEKLFEIYWGQPLLGGSTETWFAYVFALIVLVFRPQGLFGEKIIERV